MTIQGGDILMFAFDDVMNFPSVIANWSTLIQREWLRISILMCCLVLMHVFTLHMTLLRVALMMPPQVSWLLNRK